MKPRYFFHIVLLILAGISCQEERIDPACGGADPIQDLAWLKELSEEWEDFVEYTSVKRFVFEEEDFFMLLSCHPNCFCPPLIYTCEGESISFEDDRMEAYSKLGGKAGNGFNVGKIVLVSEAIG